MLKNSISRVNAAHRLAIWPLSYMLSLDSSYSTNREIKMPAKVDLEYLRENIDHHINRLGQNQRIDKRYATWITLYNAFSGAAITAAIGASQFLPKLEVPLQILALLLGATQAIINAFGSLFEHKRLWIIAAQSRRRFFSLREDIVHAERSGSLDEELLSEFYERYKLGLEHENNAWDELRSRS